MPSSSPRSRRAIDVGRRPDTQQGPFEDGVYRTAESGMLFFDLQAQQGEKETLVALTGIEPVYPP
jgi:hypothetical protein